ncbi:MAG: hypothetical protein RQ875_05520 [Vicingaceae bacterium]|nr:hypothetical protein [Vicingaceae bacterium]
MQEVIIDAGKHEYLSEFIEDLPDNAILNKVLTGCGMTSVALGNDVKYVIAVPFISLIENKQEWCKKKGIKLLAIHSNGAKAKDIAEYTGNKIMVTYDSLRKVATSLEERGDIKDWKLCVDESHKLLDSAIFRPDAIDSVLESFPKFKSYVFGTATPVPDKYQLPALNGIKKVTIKWNKIVPVKVNYCHYKKSIHDVAALTAISFLKGERNGNAHIFINSVYSICNIIRTMKKGGYDVPNDMRIVCSYRDFNINTIKKHLGKDYYINSVGSPVKKINFYTATAFEGCDIYDVDAHNIIVTDGSKDHTKIEITTILPQIIGRVRDSKTKNSVELLYSNSEYIDISEEEFEKNIKNELEQAKDTVKLYNITDNSVIKEALDKGLRSNKFIRKSDSGILSTNDNMLYNEMFNFLAHKKTYYVSQSDKVKGITNGTTTNNSIPYQYRSKQRIEIKGLNKVRLGKVPSFKDLCLEYKEIPNGVISMKRIEIKEVEPLIEEGFKVLGADKMKALEYRKTDIQKELTLRKHSINHDWKLVQLLDYKSGQFISNTRAKNDLQAIYDKLGIYKKAKATELKKLYLTESTSSRVNSKKVAGFKIINSKIKESAP